MKKGGWREEGRRRDGGDREEWRDMEREGRRRDERGWHLGRRRERGGFSPRVPEASEVFILHTYCRACDRTCH